MRIKIKVKTDIVNSRYNQVGYNETTAITKSSIGPEVYCIQLHYTNFDYNEMDTKKSPLITKCHFIPDFEKVIYSQRTPIIAKSGHNELWV